VLIDAYEPDANFISARQVEVRLAEKDRTAAV
jgi:hypothetical protein